MTELIGEIFSTIFNGNVALATVIVSMIPIMELKGGIPFGMSKAFWGDSALGRWEAFWWAFLGCTIVSIVLYFAFVPIMKFLRKTKMFKSIAKFIDNRIGKQTSKYDENEIEKSNDGQLEEQSSENNTKNNQSRKTRFGKILGVFLFVAIPLPLTGVWMGTCLAVVLGLNFWETITSTIVGNLIAGFIISTVCVIFPQFTHWLIYVFLILVIVVIIIEIIRNKIIKNKQKIK